MPDKNAYHRKVLASASDEVMFVGHVGDRQIVESLQYYAYLYFHGHQIGGSNTSLIEAMSVGNPILAHKNHLNFWIAENNAVYFEGTADCANKLAQLLKDRQKLQTMSKNSLARYYREYADDRDLKAYEEVFLNLIDRDSFLPAEKSNSLQVKSVV